MFNQRTKLRALLALPLVGLLCCSHDPVVIVTLRNLTSEVDNLVVGTQFTGQRTPIVHQIERPLTRFGVRLAEDARGTLSVVVLARDGRGCYVLEGDGSRAIAPDGSAAVDITLVRNTPPQCSPPPPPP